MGHDRLGVRRHDDAAVAPGPPYVPIRSLQQAGYRCEGGYAVPGPLPRIAANDTTATIDPVGGHVATFEVGPRSILFDPAERLPELRDWVDPPGTWIHAGNPVLFPQAGTLADHRFVEAGTTIKSHGLVYQRTWTVDLQEPSRLVLSIESDAEARRAFPFTWRLEEEVAVRPGVLRCAHQQHGRRDAAGGTGMAPVFQPAAGGEEPPAHRRRARLPRALGTGWRTGRCAGTVAPSAARHLAVR